MSFCTHLTCPISILAKTNKDLLSAGIFLFSLRKNLEENGNLLFFEGFVLASLLIDTSCNMKCLKMCVL